MSGRARNIRATPVASLAAAVLDEEAARQAAQASAREQVIFPDDLLPGVNSEPCRCAQGLARRRQAHVRRPRAALVSFDELEGAAINVLAPGDPRDVPHQQGHGRVHRHRVGRVLRARRGPDGLARRPREAGADRRHRRACSSAFFVFLSGLAVNAFMLFWTRFATGIAKANSIPVHQSLIADNYPIGIRARMSAAMQHRRATASGSSARCSSRGDRRPGPAAPRAGAGRGSSSASRSRSSRSLAFFMKEPPRGQFEKDDVLGEVIEDEQPGADLDGGRVRPAQEDRARSARARRVLRARASACSAWARCTSLYLNDNLHVDRRPAPRASSSASRASPRCRSCRSSARYFDRTYRKNPAKALALVGAADPAVGAVHAAAVLDAQHDAGS